MVAEVSPEWLPPGFTAKVKYKNGRKIKYYYNNKTGSKHYSKKDVIRCATTDNDQIGTSQTTKEDDKGLSSSEKGDAVLDKKNDSPYWLPNGWIMEERERQSGSRKGASYKVYIEPLSGSKFYSTAAVTRYLNTVNHSTTVTSQNLGDVDKTLLDTPKCISKRNTIHASKKTKRDGSFKMVGIETTADEDLPPGWIKEIRTSKSGNRIRKDPFYIDPASGYIFRSKRDALRYLETKDIGSCACRPHKRALDDPKLVMNEIPSSNPVNETLSNHKTQLFTGEESNNGREADGTKSLQESEAKVLKQPQETDVLDCVEVTSVGVNSRDENMPNKNLSKNGEMENNPEPANVVTKEDPRVMNVDAAICSPVTDPLLTRQQLSENQMEKKVCKIQLGSSKSKKRGDSSLPSRTSKRLARCEPEMLPDLDLSERSFRAAVRNSCGIKVDASPELKGSASTTLPPDIEPEKGAVEPPSSISDETLKETELLDKVEKPLPTIDETLKETELLDKVEKPHSTEPVIRDDPAGGKTSEKNPDGSIRSQEPLFRYDFGESWSDPLEFAFKTLRGEISMEDTLKFTSSFNNVVDFPANQASGCLKSSQSDAPVSLPNECRPLSEFFAQPGAIEHVNIPYNQAGGCFKSSQSDAPINFQREFAPHVESFKQHNTIHQWTGNPPFFSAPDNTSFPSCSGFSSQSNTEAGKKDCPTNFNR